MFPALAASQLAPQAPHAIPPTPGNVALPNALNPAAAQFAAMQQFPTAAQQFPTAQVPPIPARHFAGASPPPPPHPPVILPPQPPLAGQVPAPQVPQVNIFNTDIDNKITVKQKAALTSRESS